MGKTHKAMKYTLLSVAIAVGIVWTGSHREKKPLPGKPRSYEEIRVSGVLRAVTEYNAISYHVAGDTVQGFDYELLHEFAETQGLRLEITPEMSYEERLKGILQGQYDILATGTLVTTRSKDSLLFTHTLALGKQVLVQRKPKEEDDSTYVKNPLELAHKTLYVTENSPALLRIHNLMNEIADTIYVKEIKDYGPEQLMAMVAGGDIPYTVCDESIAQASIGDFPELDIQTGIGFTQLYAWGVSKTSTELADSLNTWLDKYTKTNDYKKLYKKYFN